MKNLSTREKVLISLVAAAVVFAVIGTHLPTGDTRIAQRLNSQAADLKDFSTQLSLNLARNGISLFEASIIEKAANQWPADPFFIPAGQDPVSTSNPASPEVSDWFNAATLSYSGYLQMGQRELAIINGREYEVGEHLADNAGSVLQRISSTRAVLLELDTGAEIVLQIEDY